ncbi:MAG: AMP-binding protein [Acidobacteria bacterium]|nr:AMP-binding protein [Acidobacteriota bacterium]
MVVEKLVFYGSGVRGREQTDRSIPNVARLAADRFGDDEAVVDGDTRLSFLELEQLMLRATRAAIASGVEPGDRVAIWAPNAWEWIVTALGLLGAGAWLVPLNTRFKGEEAAFVLAKAGAHSLFTVTGFLDNDYIGMLRAADPTLAALEHVVVIRGTAPAGTLGWDDFLTYGDAIPSGVAEARIDALGPKSVADIIFTSGTTGRPKGVPITHGQSIHFYDYWGDKFGLRRGDRYLVVNPFFHCFGYKAGWMLALLKGATTVPLAVFDAGTVVDIIEQERISALPGPPTLFSAVLDLPERANADLSSLRVGFVGASAVSAELLRRMRNELPFEQVTTGYGLTESSAMCAITRGGDDPEYVAEWNGGEPFPDIEIKVIDDEGNTLPAGEPGELMILGDNVMSGYFDDPDATADALEPDGWLHTGDIAVMNERGDFKITDRKKDIYVSGGFNVSPAEVEGLLAGMDEISQIAVVGVPDDRLGEVGAAYVIAKPGATVTPEGVIAWARQHVANYKVPRFVHVVESLPLNATGKVLKGELRARSGG